MSSFSTRSQKKSSKTVAANVSEDDVDYSSLNLRDIMKFCRSLRFPTLTQDNWVTWKFRVTSTLRSEDLDVLLTSDEIIGAPSEAVEKWSIKIADALIASIDDALLLELGLIFDGAVLTPKMIWESLTVRFSVRAPVRKA